jgi:hypothetical protein
MFNGWQVSLLACVPHLIDVQAADASARRHEQLVAENQKLERDYERFRRRKNLQERVAVSGACSDGVACGEVCRLRVQRKVAEASGAGRTCKSEWR